jgi:hypothetical protein
MKNQHLHSAFKTIILFLVISLISTRVESYQPVVVNGITYDDETVAKLITVITSTSPVKSMPEPEHIYPAQASLFRIPAFALCKKIIVFDEVRPGGTSRLKNAYNGYKQKILELTRSNLYFSNTELVFCPEWGHLTGTLVEAMKHVTTPFIYVHQHDLQLTQDFDLNGLIASMIENPLIQCVFLGGGNNSTSHVYHGPVDQNIIGPHFVPLWRCFGWTDQAQITTVNYYKNIVFPQCKAHKGSFMEQVMLHRLRYDLTELGVEKVHPIYGTYLYGGPMDGSYLLHSDARNK